MKYPVEKPSHLVKPKVSCGELRGYFVKGILFSWDLLYLKQLDSGTIKTLEYLSIQNKLYYSKLLQVMYV